MPSMFGFREERARRALYPNQPWLWRREWMDGHIPSGAAVSPGCLWAFGILWLVMCSPVLFFFIPRDIEQRLLLTIFRFIFPAAGIAILIAAAYLTLRKWKYGLSYCRLDAVPAQPGKTLRAEIETHVLEQPPRGFAVTLTCLRRVTTSGHNSQTTEHVLWQEDAAITSVMPGTAGMRVPVAFELPQDAEVTDESDAANAIIWRLDVKASVPGIDYAARFELPVFQTDAHSVVVTARPTHDDALAWTPAADSPVTVAVGPHGGDEIRIAPRRTASDWAALIVFFAVFTGFLFIFKIAGAPSFVLAFIVLIEIFFLVLVIDFLMGRTLVQAESSGLTIRRWRTHSIAANDIEAIEPGIGLTTAAVAYYDVNVKLKNGNVVKAAKLIRKKREAEMLAARLRRMLRIN